MRLRSFVALPLSVILALPVRAQATSAAPVWRIDRTHSSVQFQIRHFVSKVRGSFKDWKGTITADPAAWQNGSVEVQIATASISTDNDKRDAHLRSSDFFAADSFPTITFRSTRIERHGDAAKIYGTLTIRGVTRPVVLDGEFTGLMKSGQGDRVGFEASTTIDRTAFGVSWNRAAEGGGAMLGDEVRIEIAVEAVRASS